MTRDPIHHTNNKKLFPEAPGIVTMKRDHAFFQQFGSCKFKGIPSLASEWDDGAVFVAPWWDCILGWWYFWILYSVYCDFGHFGVCSVDDLWRLSLNGIRCDSWLFVPFFMALSERNFVPKSILNLDHRSRFEINGLKSVCDLFSILTIRHYIPHKEIRVHFENEINHWTFEHNSGI